MIVLVLIFLVDNVYAQEDTEDIIEQLPLPVIIGEDLNGNLDISQPEAFSLDPELVSEQVENPSLDPNLTNNSGWSPVIQTSFTNPEPPTNCDFLDINPDLYDRHWDVTYNRERRSHAIWVAAGGDDAIPPLYWSNSH